MNVDQCLNSSAFFATEIGGVKICENERVMRWFPSANRDPEVFDRHYDFDVTRHPNLHPGFGAGPHFCLGGPLAKMEWRSGSRSPGQSSESNPLSSAG